MGPNLGSDAWMSSSKVKLAPWHLGSRLTDNLLSSFRPFCISQVDFCRGHGSRWWAILSHLLCKGEAFSISSHVMASTIQASKSMLYWCVWFFRTIELKGVTCWTISYSAPSVPLQLGPGGLPRVTSRVFPVIRCGKPLTCCLKMWWVSSVNVHVDSTVDPWTMQDFLKDFIYFLFLESRREGEREGNISVWLSLTCPLLGTQPTTQAYALIRNRTGNPLVFRLALNPLSHTSQGRFELCRSTYV